MDQETSRVAAKVPPGNTIYPSIAEMLAIETLSALAQRPIVSVQVTPFQPAGWSSTLSQFLGVHLDGEEHPSIIMKRITGNTNWVMQATDDRHYRAVSVWEKGLLARLPEELDHAVLACAQEQDGYALLMLIVSDCLVAGQTIISNEESAIILDAMAALRAAYWENPSLNNPALHLCSPFDLISHTSPNKINTLSPVNSSPIGEVILDGWSKLADLFGRVFSSQIIALSNDPLPLCAALDRYPKTLVHGDFHMANLGFEKGEQNRLLLLDWARSTFSAPGLDLAFLLGINGHMLSISRDDAVEMYRQNLALRLVDRFDSRWWQPQLEIRLLAVFAMTGCFQAFMLNDPKSADERKKREEELVWWCERAAFHWFHESIRCSLTSLVRLH